MANKEETEPKEVVLEEGNFKSIYFHNCRAPLKFYDIYQGYFKLIETINHDTIIKIYSICSF